MTLAQLRAFAVARALFAPTTLAAAFDRLGFIQADPIRAPARAQDLVLRHRVAGYRVDDLDRWYVAGDLEEAYLYAHGFMRRRHWELLRRMDRARMTVLERKVLDDLAQHGASNAKDVQARLGARRAVNAWGRQATAANVALEWLHYRGLARIVGRHRGIRRYAVAPAPPETSLSPLERVRQLVLLVVQPLAPLSEPTLRRVVARLRGVVRGVRSHTAVLDDLYRTGKLTRATVDGVAYVWPALETPATPADRGVRFLAPFDPLVWDRGKFEHLWGWPYRFEAYTPVAKRVRGHYAMPLLFADRVIGWANVTAAGGALNIELGFVDGRRPAGRAFTTALDREIADLERFLGIGAAAAERE